MSESSWRQKSGAAAAGFGAGTVCGLFGGSGGMLLVPGLSRLAKVEPVRLFPTAVAVMLPITAFSLLTAGIQEPLPFQAALPYLLGSIPGGIAAGLWGKKVPLVWLHRIFGALMLLGAGRFLLR